MKVWRYSRWDGSQDEFSLDPRQAHETLERLRMFAEAGAVVCAAMHDLTMAARFAHDALLLTNDGEVAAAGPVDDVLTPQTLEGVFGARFERLAGEGGPAIVAVAPPHSAAAAAPADTMSGRAP